MSNGWYLRHHDKRAHGPFPIASILDAAKTGRILDSTELAHKTETKGKWIVATRFKELRKIIAKRPVVPAPPPSRTVVADDNVCVGDVAEPTAAETRTPQSKATRNRGQATKLALPAPQRTQNLGPLIFDADYVAICENGSYELLARDVAEGKLAIKELRRFKKELNLEIRKTNAAMKEIRTNYTAMTRHRGSMVRGGGKLGKFFRGMQSFSRDLTRSGLAHDLAPHEDQKQRLSKFKHLADTLILKTEKILADHD